MATNKNALIRYRTIDKCLQNTYRKWTLNDLILACSDALIEYEDKDSNVSKRTVQLDIQTMRSDKLGYNAPIEVYEKRYYKYSTPNYSITDIPLTDMDLDILSESMEILRQFQDFSLFTELNGVIQKLEDKIYRESKDQSPIIHLDKNDLLLGLEHLDTIYQSILKKIVLKIDYQSFKARQPAEIIFTAYILKEFNNRWFVVGRKADKKEIMTLALDRIINLDFALHESYDKKDFNPDIYYKNTFGVTVLSEKNLADIVLKIDRLNAPYVMTKPFHSSQKMVGEYADGSILIRLKLHQNYELERLILGFGDSIQVMKPRQLKQRIKKKLKKAYENYSESK